MGLNQRPLGKEAAVVTTAPLLLIEAHYEVLMSDSTFPHHAFLETALRSGERHSI